VDFRIHSFTDRDSGLEIVVEFWEKHQNVKAQKNTPSLREITRKTTPRLNRASSEFLPQ